MAYDATVHNVYITNSSNSYNVAIRYAGGFTTTIEQPATQIPFPGATPDKTMFFKFFGQTFKISFSFVLVNDGNDISDGTPGSITTLAAQINYLQNTFFTAEYNTSYNVQSDSWTGTKECIVTNISIQRGKGQPTFATGTITLQEGTLNPLDLLI